ncbi:methyl-accepting chemotaxis protein [Xanthomonas sp. XNM01]|uniref:methyl-accepting chemotaxis protein n=1 Tax=Xanthomonas sp. XNM01 TaxID=2769289 RepID=UPI0017830228|nr:methyl-accepting chemotaxis protein [Xanthomonas sp. XNM01]MBD9367588.1 HAMP domain-containing protein [Xanthomonas sp. XNM01]
MASIRTTPAGRHGSIAHRLMLGTGLLALLCFGLTAALSQWISKRALVASSRATIESIAHYQSARIGAELESTFKANDTLVNTLLATRALHGLERESVDAVFRQQLLANPTWVGTGVLWEAGAFDGRNPERLLSYWTWDDDGALLYDGATPGADDAWHALPRQLRRPVLLEPYADVTEGRDESVLMTTLSTPIMLDDQYLGVVLTDLALSGLQQRLSQVQPMDAGYLELISPGGMVLASRDATRLGSHRTDPASRAMLAAIAEGRSHEQLQPDADGYVRVYVPLQAGKAEERFSLGVAVPQARLSAQFMQQARQMLWIIVLAGVASVGLLSLSLFLLVRWLLVRPLASAIAVAGDIADGRLDGTIAQGRNDEVGQLLGAMARMQVQLKAVIQAQAEMARRHDDGDIGFRIDQSAFPGDYGRMVRDTNALVASHIALMMRQMEVMQRYAIGDLSEDMDRLPGGKAVLTRTMDTVKANLGAINAEIRRLADAAADGDFAQRGDEQRYEHDFRAMIAGLNRLMRTADGNLSTLSQLFQAIADGDLTGQMDGEFNGVFARMRDDANATVTRLTGIVDRIQLAAASIADAAGSIASGNADLSGRSERQTGDLEAAAASMEELTATVRANAERAHQADDASRQAGDAVRETSAAIGEVVQVMAQIDQSSSRIGEIIAVIDGIAFQTNILALNAAVESARAGEEGRGFAVVANEVRGLAQRSATAAREIRGLIEESGQRVENGLAISRRSEQAIGRLNASATRTSALVNEIAAASTEQAGRLEQINLTIARMDEATHQNAALVREASSAAGALEVLAGQLEEAVSVFQTRREAGPPRAA